MDIALGQAVLVLVKCRIILSFHVADLDGLAKVSGRSLNVTMRVQQHAQLVMRHPGAGVQRECALIQRLRIPEEVRPLDGAAGKREQHRACSGLCDPCAARKSPDSKYDSRSD